MRRRDQIQVTGVLPGFEAVESDRIELHGQRCMRNMEKNEPTDTFEGILRLFLQRKYPMPTELTEY